MAHFAELGIDNVIVRVVAIANDAITDSNSDEQESLGIDLCRSFFGGTWRQTSYNKNIRKNFAGVGYTYNLSKDAFIPPKPYASWVLNDTTCLWEAPAAIPTDGKRYRWDEDSTSWVEVS
jgi:hypothetical protein